MQNANMWWFRLPIALLCVSGAGVVRADMSAGRPALNSATPIAVCKLQSLPDRAVDFMPQPAVSYSLQPLPENSLDNYERTPLRDWRMLSSAGRDDPWLRVMLLGPKRPLVIDLAVFIDGRPFREAREAWIDGLLAAPAKPQPDSLIDGKQGDSKETPTGTKTVAASSKSEDGAPPAEGRETAGNPADPQTDDSIQQDGNRRDAEPFVTARSRTAPTIRERLVDYLSMPGSTAQRDEIRWLIAEWGSGPDVLLLGSSLSWERATVAPLLAYLDGDEDGGLSATEIRATKDMLQRADTNSDDVLDANEIRRVATRPPAMPLASGHSLVVPLDEQTDWDALAATINRLYPGNRFDVDGREDAAKQVMELSADVSVRIDFQTTGNEAQGVSLLALDPRVGEAGKIVSTSPSVITLDLGGDYLEFSAAQPAGVDRQNAEGTQVSVGAVLDGNPLTRLTDRDNDQRLTIRERQELAELLAALDRDGDGDVQPNELPLPIRFAVTLGPHVHELLATPVAAARTIAPLERMPTAPAWFVSMDKNGDHDLSRGEFLGTTEQFRQFDADGNGLLGVAEAIKHSSGQ
jgi:hypothetical protein